jgi:hypothetical protein
MNAAMNVTGQHETHPDAETLSAFTEQALNAHERGDVLAHLAVCGRCRQVVVLAREAAGGEVAAAQREVGRSKVWWRSWGLALVPAAALAATAVIAFYIHERAIERTSDVAKLEQQQPNEKPATPPQAPEQPPAQAAAPPPAVPVDAQPKPGAQARSRETERPGEERRKPAPVPDETAAAPPPEPPDGPASEREEYRRPSSLETRGAMADAHDPTRASAEDKTPSEAAMYDEERKKNTDEAADERHQFAAKAATPSSPHDSGNDNAGTDNGGSAPAESPSARSSQQVEVNALQLETRPAPEANSGELKSLRLSGFSGALMGRPIHLPSGLPALSITSSDHRVIAVDKKGTLFFSDNSGFTWEKVKRQWTGRAILVRTRTSEDATPPAANVPETAGSASVSDALSHPETVFELVNDQSELWLSADGRIWTAK